MFLTSCPPLPPRHVFVGPYAVLTKDTMPQTYKRKRSWSRAVFSNLQRKGLEKRFEIQKYVTKPDRKQLAAMLGLTDAQVRGSAVDSHSPRPACDSTGCTTTQSFVRASCYLSSRTRNYSFRQTHRVNKQNGFPLISSPV